MLEDARLQFGTRKVDRGVLGHEQSGVHWSTRFLRSQFPDAWLLATFDLIGCRGTRRSLAN